MPRERLHPDDRDRAREAVEQSLRDRGIDRRDYRVDLPVSLRRVGSRRKVS